MAQLYLNGDFLQEEEASVSVLDRGFIFGDGIYEVIPCYGGKIFRLAEHLSRLVANLKAVKIPNLYGNNRWQSILEELVKRNGGGDFSLYLQVTRGVARRDHVIQEEITPTVVAFCIPIDPPEEDDYLAGFSAITLDDIRWKQCQIKSISLLANVLLRQQAMEEGADEAILIRDGLAVEGAASNLFIVKNGCLITPPKGPDLLPGITRDLVLELAVSRGVANSERDITLKALLDADEVWLTSSTKEIMPVTRLNSAHVGEGAPGPVWREIFQAYQGYKEAIRRGTVS